MSLVIRRFISTASRNIFVFNESNWPAQYLSQAKATCSIYENFISEDEENSLLKEVEPHMKRLRVSLTSWLLISIVLV